MPAALNLTEGPAVDRKQADPETLIVALKGTQSLVVTLIVALKGTLKGTQNSTPQTPSRHVRSSRSGCGAACPSSAF